jgi:cellulose synthase/poly-beta-1,6-N-acetylglucosamine synthase-like glycosyltransferase
VTAFAALVDAVTTAVVPVILGYFVLLNACYLLLVAGAVLEIRRERQERAASRVVLGSRLAPTISLLAPAHNEAATIADSVQSLLTLDYPNVEVVVVNDGSGDRTIDVLRREFDLVPVHRVVRAGIPTRPLVALYRSRRHANLVVADKVNGGKADALNAGLALASGELVCAIDADTLIERGALVKLVRPFIERDDVVAAGGMLRPANEAEVRLGQVVRVRAPSRWLPGVQVVEYMRAFVLGRLGLNVLGGNLIVSGAFGLFRRDAMFEVGGWLGGTVGEDMELIVRLRRHGCERGRPGRVVFVPTPTAWTEVPTLPGVLGRQRDRWQRGLCDTLWRHRALLGNPRYGALGLFVVPYFWIVEMLAPVVEGLGLVLLAVGALAGTVDPQFAGLFLALAAGTGLLLTMAALLLDQIAHRRYERLRDLAILCWWAVLEPFGYRQLTVWWRLRGMVRYLRGHGDWGAMARTGFHRVDKRAA